VVEGDDRAAVVDGHVLDRPPVGPGPQARQQRRRRHRALLGGRLLPPGLLAEMTTPVDTGVPGFGCGLGPTVIQAPLIPAPAGRLIGHDGGITGFLNNGLSTQDGRRQLGVMLNELFAPPGVVEAYVQAWLTIGVRLLGGAPVGVASTSASLRAAIRAGMATPTASGLDRSSR
jgi:hypothetical protein